MKNEERNGYCNTYINEIRHGDNTHMADFVKACEEICKSLIRGKGFMLHEQNPCIISGEEDLFQETMSLLWANLSKVDTEKSFVQWFRKICTNAYYKIYNRETKEAEKRADLQPSDDPDVDVTDQISGLPADINVEESSINSLMDPEEHLRDSLSRLDPKQYEAMMLHYVDGLSVKEVAERKGVPVSTVNNWLARGCRNCRQDLRRNGISKDMFDDREV